MKTCFSIPNSAFRIPQSLSISPNDLPPVPNRVALPRRTGGGGLSSFESSFLKGILYGK